MFAKPLQWLDFDQLADFLVQEDWDGIEATVRPGGQVAPERARDELPRLFDALKAKEKRVVILASAINQVDDLVIQTLETAAKLKIPYYRMAYYHYDLSRPILPQLDAFATQVARLVEINRELGLTALYHNHAGTRYVGAGLWDLQQLLMGQDSRYLSVAFDIRHATAEAPTTWPIHWSMLQGHLGALYLKDFVWKGRRPQNVPLGTGLVDPKYFDMIKVSPLTRLPISLHMEYVDHRKRELSPKSLQALRMDRAALKNLLDR